MRISDWSSDVCSSDLRAKGQAGRLARGLPQSNGPGTYTVRWAGCGPKLGHHALGAGSLGPGRLDDAAGQNGRASCRERVWQSVYISAVAVSLKKTKDYQHTSTLNSTITKLLQ